MGSCGVQVQKTLWSQEEANRISAFIPINKSMERNARTLPCGQLMSGERPALLLAEFLDSQKLQPKGGQTPWQGSAESEL